MDVNNACERFVNESDDDNGRVAKVVTLRNLENHIRIYSPSSYWDMRREYDGDIQQFFSQDGLRVSRKNLCDDWEEWNFEIMTAGAYDRDKRHDHGYFSPLRCYCNSEENLFLVYLRQNQKDYQLERQLYKVSGNITTEMNMHYEV